ncbi:MAG: helix-turn-helix transcriptional regulator [Eubacteriales bacterium]
MNNLKDIRDLFGYSQEEVAQALEVSRVTISKWENDEVKINPANLEKLSLLFNIGPEFICERKLDSKAIEQIQKAGKNIREREKKDQDGTKYFEVIKRLTKIDVRNFIRDYFLSTKLLLVKAEEIGDAQLDDLVEVNKKLGARLRKIQEDRRKNNGVHEDAHFLNDLINKYDSDDVE